MFGELNSLKSFTPLYDGEFRRTSFRLVYRRSSLPSESLVLECRESFKEDTFRSLLASVVVGGVGGGGGGGGGLSIVVGFKIKGVDREDLGL